MTPVLTPLHGPPKASEGSGLALADGVPVAQADDPDAPRPVGCGELHEQRRLRPQASLGRLVGISISPLSPPPHLIFWFGISSQGI